MYESIRILWFMLWRSLLMSGLFGGIIGLFKWLFAPDLPLLFEIASLYIVFPLIIFPIILSLMIRKKFKGFRIVVIRDPGPEVSS